VTETVPEEQIVSISPEFKRHSQARLAELRERGPIHRVVSSSGVESWLVVGYELAREALTHPALLKNSEPSEDALAAAGFTGNKPGVGLGGQMLEADPPEHTRLRKLVSGAFTPRRTQELGPRIQEISDALIDSMAAAPGHEADLVQAFTGPLPVTVIAELLGIPESDRDDFRVWTSRALDYSSPGHRAAIADLHRLLAGLIEDKRARPADDLLSDLIAKRDQEAGMLSDQELVGTALLLIVAGHETTVNLLGNALFALLRDPEQAQLLRDRPELIPQAVEEFLRYDPSVELTTFRYAAADLELGGQPIARGDVLAVALTSASRDAPNEGDRDSLDVTRSNPRHLAFGHGIHHCLGAPLARLEAVTALSTFLRRVDGLEATRPLDEIDWIPAGMMHGPLQLPVRFKEIAAAAPGTGHARSTSAI
jgi:cytochrome P450